MKSYFVYILQCSDNSYYTGVTNDLEKRLNEHNLGIDESCYTFNRRPATLVFSQSFSDPMTAIEREKQIKGWSRRKKKALILGDFDKLSEFAKSKSQSSASLPRLRGSD